MAWVASEGVKGAFGGEVAIEVGVLSHKSWDDTAGCYGAIRVYIFFVGGYICADFGPEGHTVAEEFQIGEFLEDFFEAWQADFIEDAIIFEAGRYEIRGHSMKGDWEADNFAGFEEVQHTGMVPGDSGGELAEAFAAELFVLGESEDVILCFEFIGVLGQSWVKIAERDEAVGESVADGQHFADALVFAGAFGIVELHNYGLVDAEAVHYLNLLLGGEERRACGGVSDFGICVDVSVGVNEPAANFGRRRGG